MPELTCPVCGGALHREERSLRCGAGHCYDLARQGYVNLLRTNRSKDKRHGDDKRMVAARTAFLDAGYYAPLRDAIAAAATEYTTGDAGVLDAGCGEGYYTAHVLHTLQAQETLDWADAGNDLENLIVSGALAYLTDGKTLYTCSLPEGRVLQAANAETEITTLFCRTDGTVVAYCEDTGNLYELEAGGEVLTKTGTLPLLFRSGKLRHVSFGFYIIIQNS